MRSAVAQFLEKQLVENPRLRVISLGAGVQSTTMALMAAHGEITPMPDCAIFADTQNEPSYVYEHLSWLKSKNVLPFPVYSVTNGNLFVDATEVVTTKDKSNTYVKVRLPVFLLFPDGTKGLEHRWCTSQYKIIPIQKKIKQLIGKQTKGDVTEVWIGISLDEAIRMKPSPETFIRNRWPLLEKEMSRKACVSWLTKHDYPIPKKSACTFCPFHDNDWWRSRTKEEFEDCVEKERQLQQAYAQTNSRGIPFFHPSCTPLNQIDFTDRSPKYFNLFNNECEGRCGV